MNQPPLTVLAVGATGSIGRYVVEEALRQGHKVRALVRNPGKLRLPAEVEIVVGDLTRPESLLPAVDGIDAIVFTHGTYGNNSSTEQIDYGGVRNVLAALGSRRARIALMTAIAVTDRKSAHDWKRRAERLVRVSGLPYTIVRPGWFDYNEPDQLRLVLMQGDQRQSGTPRDGVVARRQVAEVLVRSLKSDAAQQKTFELVAEAGARTTDFERLFMSVDADNDCSLDAVHDAANMPISEEPRSVVSAIEACRRQPRPRSSYGAPHRR